MIHVHDSLLSGYWLYGSFTLKAISMQFQGQLSIAQQPGIPNDDVYICSCIPADCSFIAGLSKQVCQTALIMCESNDCTKSWEKRIEKTIHLHFWFDLQSESQNGKMSYLNYTGCVKRTEGPAGIKESNFNQSSFQRKWLWQWQGGWVWSKIDEVNFKQGVVLCQQDYRL